MEERQNVQDVPFSEEEKENSSPDGAKKPRKLPQALQENVGRGRTKGVPNRLTKTMKEAIEQAFDKAGGVDYLVSLSKGTASDRAAFVNLVGRLLPLQVNSNIDQRIRVELGWLGGRNVGRVLQSDTESLSAAGKSITHQEVEDGDFRMPSAGIPIDYQPSAEGGNE